MRNSEPIGDQYVPPRVVLRHRQSEKLSTAYDGLILTS